MPPPARGGTAGSVLSKARPLIDSFQRALIHCTLGAALQPPTGPLAFSRRLALGSEFVELLIQEFWLLHGICREMRWIRRSILL